MITNNWQLMEQFTLKEKDGPRVRFAPAPTGPFHIGGARTALFNYLFARKNQGSFIVRIENTDVERSDPKWEDDIMQNLKWLGILWDEGIAYAQNQKLKMTLRGVGDDSKNQKCTGYIGEYGPYRQSERKAIYENYIKKLYDAGFLYWCYCTEEELEAQKQEQISIGEPPHYVGHCRDLSKEKQDELIEQGRKRVLRFKVAQRRIKLQDLIRGELEFDTELFGDFIVARDFSTPFYNLAVVIDDFEMKINYIIRGEDHISNTPKQILIQEALGFSKPKYAHLPLILGPDRSKLSKRHGTMNISDYRDQGYLPEAMVNFMALLGWNPGTKEEKFTMTELIERFSLERVQKGGAVFNIERLNWTNGYYLRKMPLAELAEKCLPYLIKNERLIMEDKRYKIKETGDVVGLSYLENIVSLFQERLKKLSEIVELSDFFFKGKLEYDPKMLIWKNLNIADIQTSLKKCYSVLQNIDKEEWQREMIKEVLMKEAEKETDRGRLLWPLRVALTGKKFSPPPFEITEILGKEKTLKRIEEALKLIETNRN